MGMIEVRDIKGIMDCDCKVLCRNCMGEAGQYREEEFVMENAFCIDEASGEPYHLYYCDKCSARLV
jgi:hypothetical protein